MTPAAVTAETGPPARHRPDRPASESARTAGTLWPRRPGPVLDWLVQEGRHLPTVEEILAALAERLVEAGFPLLRASINLRTLHPQWRAVAMIWRRGEAEVEFFQVEHGIERRERYIQSPLRLLYDEGAGAVRQRLDRPESELAFPIYRELKAAGATDYVALPVRFADGRVHATTWSTDAPGGFASDHLIRIYDLLPILALLVEARLTRRIARNLLDTYVGHHAGARILDGEITRGTGSTVDAAIWLSDLRGFTAMTESLPGEALIRTLNDYFEVMAAAVESHGGEILKFIGDGLLAVFPLDTPRAICRAVWAAREARGGMATLNRRRETEGKAPLAFGIALHAGEVVYGNIGAPNRLDFTVIGPAVNQANRIEALCATLGRDILLSAPFAATCLEPTVSLGFHGLKGLSEPAEIFALADAA